jgi:tetratricopeptide (TPR) repeat protein
LLFHGDTMQVFDKARLAMPQFRLSPQRATHEAGFAGNRSLPSHRLTGMFTAWLARKLRLGPKPIGAVQGATAYSGTRDPVPSLQAVPKPAPVLTDVDVLNAGGRYAESLAALKRALETFPGDKDLLLAKASTLYAWGRLREAYREFLRADEAGFVGPTLDIRLGWTCHQIGKPDEAESRMRKVVDDRSDSAEAHFGLGVVLASAKRYDEAIASYERALELAPDHKHCMTNLGICRLQQGNLAAAETWFRRTVACHPENTVAWMNLGTALWRQDRREAFAAFERAQQLEADGGESSDLFSNYGNALQNSDRVQQALELFERNLPRRPHAIAQGNFSMALLAAGRLAEGWNHYEFRWFQDLLLPLRANFEQPVWSGQDLEGKTILVRAEQGIGDIIQFIRYAPRLKALGAFVVLQNRPGMDEIAGAFDGVDRVLAENEPLPEFDYYIHIMSLPRVFGTDIDSVPAEVPYLRVDPIRVERWTKRLSDGCGLKVGIVWAGRPAHVRDPYRSIPLQSLLPIRDVEDVQLYSLQKGAGATQLQPLGGDAKIVDLQEQLTDFAETAAAISLLDLVISVDTSVAHLAGALGKPVWILLPHPAEWRWLEGREDTPWYPSARLFRQRKAGDWDDVVERVKAKLQEMASQRRKGMIVAGSRPTMPSRDPALRGLPRAMTPMRVAPGMSAAAEMRHGIFQYLPHHDDAGRSLGWYGEWLEPQLKLLIHLIRLEQTVMEVDAGVGAHSIALARAVGPDGHLIVYESQPKQKSILIQNIQANRAMNVTIMQRSLTDKRESKADRSDGFDLPGRTLDSGQAVDCTETLDDLQLERLDWLKLNDAGRTAALLEEGRETLWRLRPRIFARTADETASLSLAGRLKLFGYQCWRTRNPLFNPDNFYRHDQDVFSGRVADAILAIPEEIDVDVALDGCIEVK